MGRFLSLFVLAAFVPLIGRDLPATVASHFAGDGHANGYMARGAYLTFMAVLTVGVPGLMMLLGANARRLPQLIWSLPHRDYWLAPERREATVEYLSDFLTMLGWIAAGFFVFLHWAVTQANRLSPPRLPPEWFLPGLAVFLLLVVGMVIRLYRRFPRPPREKPGELRPRR